MVDRGFCQYHARWNGRARISNLPIYRVVLLSTKRKSLTRWPKMEIAWALRNHAELILEELPPFPKFLNTLSVSTMMEDMVLGESVIAKLKHVSLASDERCTMCFIPRRRDHNNIRFVVKRIEHLKADMEKTFLQRSARIVLCGIYSNKPGVTGVH